MALLPQRSARALPDQVKVTGLAVDRAPLGAALLRGLGHDESKLLSSRGPLTASTERTKRV
eukprot:14606267-Alexandrium_andersonii.AAC.1